MSSLVQSDTAKKWDAAYAGGSDKRYPNLDLVRLGFWFFENKPGKLLEYGHGCGVNLIHLLESGHKVEAIDASIEAQKVVTKKLAQRPELGKNANLTHLEIGMSALPYEDETFDYITCVSVLSLLASREKVQQLLAEFVRVLKPGGKAILDINSPNSDFARDARKLENDIYVYTGDGPEHSSYCPEKGTFIELVNPFFKIDDVGYSAHKLMHSEIHEHIICAHKA